MNMFIMKFIYIIRFTCAADRLMYKGFEEDSKNLHYINISHNKLLATQNKFEQEKIIAEVKKKTGMTFIYVNSLYTFWEDIETSRIFIVNSDTERKDYQLSDDAFLSLNDDYVAKVDMILHTSARICNELYYKLNIHCYNALMRPLSVRCLVDPKDDFYLGKYYDYDHTDVKKYEMVRYVTCCLLNAVNYLQKNQILHTKIMPSTVMLCKDKKGEINCKLFYMHESIKLVVNGCSPNCHQESCANDTNQYNCEYFTHDDIWDVGYTALVLFTGVEALSLTNDNGHVLSEKNIKAYLIENNIKGVFYEFLLRSLTYSNFRKLSAETLLRDEYFNYNIY